MSKYTTEVRFICESAAGYSESKGGNSVEGIIAIAAPMIFNFNFPIFDESYRAPLERKILRHFYTREICEETVGLWKLRLNDRMNTIMPYYNKLYSSELLQFDPLHDVDLTRSVQRENTGEETTNTLGSTSGSNETETSGSNSLTTSETGSSTKTGTRWDLYSDTPQGGITGMGTDENKYLTNARKITDNETNSNTASGSVTGEQSNTGSSTTSGSYQDSATKELSSTEEYIERLAGKQGTQSYSSLIKEFRQTFLNIDRMILDELEDLFFGLCA